MELSSNRHDADAQSPSIVITGTGVITAAGAGVGRLFDSMLAHSNPFDSLENEGANQFKQPWPVAKVAPADSVWPDHDPWWVNNLKFANLSARWAVSAAGLALEATGQIEQGGAERSGVIMAVPSGEEEGVKIIPKLAAIAQTDSRPLATVLYEEVPDYSYVRGIPSQTGQFIAKLTGYLGSNVAVFGEAGAGGLSAASLALRLIKSGELDRVIVVGVAPPLSPATLASLDRHDGFAAKAVAGSGPFDRARAGTLLGQGAAAVVFERNDVAARRGVKPLAGIAACETACGATVEKSVESALNFALTTGGSDIDLWFSHAAGSPVLDRIQCEVIAPAVAKASATSSKGSIGLAFECAGLIDLALAVESLRRKTVPPVGLLRDPDPTLGGIDFVVNSAKAIPAAKAALVTSMTPSSGATGAAGAAIVTQIED